MKKLMLLALTLFALSAVNANAQTSIDTLKQKISEAPMNQYGDKRINYGTWKNKQKIYIFAYYNKKEGYMLCKVKNGKPTKTRIEKINFLSSDLLKESKNLRPENWYAVTWPLLKGEKQSQ